MIFYRQWSYELYKVSGVSRASPGKSPLYTLFIDGDEVPRKFLRSDLLMVEPKKLIRELDADEYVVDRVLAKKGRGTKLQYLVSWVGWPPEHNSWIRPASSFQGAIDAFVR
jgi:hypothetical protein